MALGDLFNPLLSKLKSLLGPIGKLWDFFTNFWSRMGTAFNQGTEFAGKLITEINAWKNFALSIPFRTGVINLPKAIENTRELINQIVLGWRSIVDLGTQLKNQLPVDNPAADAQEALKALEEGGLKDILSRFPKLIEGAEKILGFAAIILGALDSIAAAIDDLTQILDAITAIREEFEFGSTIFLQQKNARKRVDLTDGSSMLIRVGSMHS